MKIQIRDLDFQYYPDRPLFQKVNLDVPLDSLVIITGNSGSGKTTLLKLIAGLLQPANGRIDFVMDGIQRDDIHFGYLFQNPDDQIVHFNIEREVAFNLENRGVAPIEMKVQVEQILNEYKLFDRRSDSPNYLSGGEKQRLALAGMMVSKPDILLLDEPCSFLDVNAQIQLYQKIAELRENKVSIIWISQEDHEIRMADHVIELGTNRIFTYVNGQNYLQKTGVTDAR